MIEKLLEYQREDANLKKIENQLSNSEERKKAKSAKKTLDAYAETVKVLEVKAEHLLSEVENAKLEQEKLIEQQKELSGLIDGVSEEGEASFLVKKADELIAKIKNISASISNLTAEMQKVIAEYAQSRKSYKEAQAVYSENAPKYAELKKSFSAEMSQIEAKLAEIKKGVEPSLMDRYEKKRASKIYPIVYEVTSNVCGACNMELPMAVLNKLKNGEVIECDQCGRMLYQK